MSPPWRRRPPLFVNVAFGLEAKILGTQATEFLLEGRKTALTREGLIALLLESGLPGTDEVLVEAEGASGLGDRVAFLGDELDGLEFELAREGAA
jgi:hypothetical protein